MADQIINWTAISAVSALFVAVGNWTWQNYLQRQKLKHDLYVKRFEVYSQFVEFLWLPFDESKWNAIEGLSDLLNEQTLLEAQVEFLFKCNLSTPLKVVELWLCQRWGKNHMPKGEAENDAFNEAVNRSVGKMEFATWERVSKVIVGEILSPMAKELTLTESALQAFQRKLEDLEKKADQIGLPKEHDDISQLPTEASEPVASSRRPQLTITSEPIGAEIEFGGEFIGNTPTTVTAKEGSVTVKLKKAGFQPWERTLKLNSGDKRTLNAEMSN